MSDFGSIGIVGKLLNSSTITSGLVAAAASALITWGNLSATVHGLEDRVTKIEVKQDELSAKQEQINEKLVAIDVSLGYIREYIVNQSHNTQPHQGNFNESPKK